MTMRKNMVRALSVAAVLIMMLSLAGCNLVFHVTGSDDYNVTSTAITNGPVKVDVSVKGLWPVWPDHLTVVLSGTVTTSLPLVLDPNVELANTIEMEIYNKLYNAGDNDFESLEYEEGLAGVDNMFKVTAVMAIPGWQEWFGGSGASTAVEFEGIDLATLIGQDKYPQVVASLQQACSQIPNGKIVELTLDGELVNAEKDKLVGDMSITFFLNGSLVELP